MRGDVHLRELEPGLAEPVIRYEKKVAGRQVHVDIKAFTEIPDGERMEAWGRGNVTGARGIGKTYLHSMVDDHSRLAYSALSDDQAAITCLEYTKRAVQWFADRGVRIAEMMADNGYTELTCSTTPSSVGIRHIYTRAYPPQTNDKVERF